MYTCTHRCAQITGARTHACGNRRRISEATQIPQMCRMTGADEEEGIGRRSSVPGRRGGGEGGRGVSDGGRGCGGEGWLFTTV